MRALCILLRHRVTGTLRDSPWSIGSVLGRLLLLAGLAVLLYVMGLASKNLGTLIRDVRPNADVLRVVNSGMLYLVSALTVARFVLQSPSAVPLDRYLDLPIRGTNLLRAQVLLYLLSLHTVGAIVLVGPVWAAEVWPVLPAMEAGMWLLTALLGTAVLPGLGAQLLNVLLGQYPRGFVAVLAGIVGVVAVDAVLTFSLLRGLARVLFGWPAVGLFCALAVTAGTYRVLLRTLQGGLVVDRRRRTGKTSASGQDVMGSRWIEDTLPAGRLVALDVRQIVRARRLRSLALLGLAVGMGCGGLSGASVWAKGEITAGRMIRFSVFGLGGPVYGLGLVWRFGVWAGHVEGVLTRPHSLTAIIRGKLRVLWSGLFPGTLMLLGMAPWLPVKQAIFLFAMALFWGGVVVPGFVYLGLHLRRPVDPSTAGFAVGMSLHAHAIRGLPLLLVLVAGPVGAAAFGAWLSVSAVVGGMGGIGLILVARTLRPFVQQLHHHRHEMLDGFRENDPI